MYSHHEQGEAFAMRTTIFNSRYAHSRAIRMNILINPTGRPGKFRAVDWAVELLNFFTKVSPLCGSGVADFHVQIIRLPTVGSFQTSRSNTSWTSRLSLKSTGIFTKYSMKASIILKRQH